MYQRYETSPFYLTFTHPSVGIHNKIHIRQRSMRTLGKNTKKHSKKIGLTLSAKKWFLLRFSQIG